MNRNISRRNFLKLFAAAGAGVTLNACGLQTRTGRAIKIGYVSPQTGPLAGFGEADNFILKGVREIFGKGISVGGVTHPVEILVTDSQSACAPSRIRNSKSARSSCRGTPHSVSW